MKKHYDFLKAEQSRMYRPVTSTKENDGREPAIEFMHDDLLLLISSRPFKAFHLVLCNGNRHLVSSPYQVSFGATQLGYFHPRENQHACFESNEIASLESCKGHEKLRPTNELIASVHRAFADVQRADGITWHEAGEIDDEWNLSPDQQRAARALDAEQSWRDVPATLFDGRAANVHYLDSVGFIYYLPAFIVADVQRGGNWKSAEDDGFLWYLKQSDRINDLKSLINKDRQAVVAKWLELTFLRHPWYQPEALELWKALDLE